MSHRDDQALIAAIVIILEDWARWQAGYSPRLGYPSRSAGVCGNGLQTFDDMCDQVDAAAMRAVDACVSDLLPIQQAAIAKRYGVSAVFRFGRMAYEDALADAHANLWVSFRRKGIA